MSTEQATKARTSVDAIILKLNRCIEKGPKTHITPEGRLDDADQYAVRILSSRIRLLNRLWIASYGDQHERMRARTELSIKNRDAGDIMKIGEKNHSIGRLDCRACDLEEVAVNGVTIRQSAARLCTRCNQAIQHVFTKRSDTLKSDNLGVSDVDEVQRALETRYPQLKGSRFPVVQCFSCELCGEVDERPIGYEIPAPTKEKWKTVLL